MTQNKTITVKAVNIVKTGVSEKDNRPWTLLNVVDENDRKYSTFDETYIKAVGQTIEIVYEEKESGMNPKTNKPYLNRNIVQAKGAAARKADIDNPYTGAIMEKLFTKLNLIQAEVEKIGKILSKKEDTIEEERPPLDEPPF